MALESKIRGKGTRVAHLPISLDTPCGWPPTLFMQLLDGDKSLYQLRKGGGNGAPALYGFIQLVHLEGHHSGQPSAKYTPLG